MDLSSWASNDISCQHPSWKGQVITTARLGLHNTFSGLRSTSEINLENKAICVFVCKVQFQTDQLKPHDDLPTGLSTNIETFLLLCHVHNMSKHNYGERDMTSLIRTFFKRVQVFVCVRAKSLQSCPTLCNPMDIACQAPLSIDSPGKNTGVGCHALLQGIFPTQGLNLYLFLSPVLAGRFFTTSTTWEAWRRNTLQNKSTSISSVC